MIFFITTDSNHYAEQLIQSYCHFHFSEKIQLFKAKSLQAVFVGCQKVELKKHVVFIYGNAFPPKNENLKSCLEEIAQQGAGQEQMNGNFNLIIFDKKEDGEADQSFSILSDRHASLPVFFSQQSACVQVSSVFELLLLDNKDCRFNESALLDYLCLGYVLPGESLWKTIQMLPKDKCLNVLPSKQELFLEDVFSKNKPDRAYYPSLKSAGEAFVEKLRETLEDEFNFLGVSQMELTGGTDTRILISCMMKLQRKSLGYRTFEQAFWSSANNDSIVAKKIAKEFNLNHFSEKIPVTVKTDFPISYLLPEISAYPVKILSGLFGSELFGGAVLQADSVLDYRLSDRIDKIKDGLFQLTVAKEDYKRLGSPWERLKHKIIYSNHPFKEQDLAQQILLRSHWTSIYSSFNSPFFIEPYYHIKNNKVCPYLDTRMIDFFLNCPREFLLSYILYEYVFCHLADKRWTEIPFHSNMMKFVEVFSKINPEKAVMGNVGVESACNYKVYFERNFSPSLFEDTFLEKISVKEADKIPSDILFKICDLNCFMLELQKRK
ncbi:MAG: hypothetical protein OXJ52_01795 [Oligoflexia bacterium]|nr:hypothetical protein [Oligoflexia bacterium]